jgi:hypothetical protein
MFLEKNRTRGGARLAGLNKALFSNRYNRVENSAV